MHSRLFSIIYIFTLARKEANFYIDAVFVYAIPIKSLNYNQFISFSFSLGSSGLVLRFVKEFHTTFTFAGS